MIKVFTDANKTLLCYVIPTDAGHIIKVFPHYEYTTNMAEYDAILTALLYIDGDVDLYSDSEWAIRQLTGVYRRLNEGARRRYAAVQALSAGRRVTFTHVKRKENLAGLYLDGTLADSSGRPYPSVSAVCFEQVGGG
jgi:ribonuclease HI